MGQSFKSTVALVACLYCLSGCGPTLTLQDFYKPIDEAGTKTGYLGGYGWRQSQGSDGTYTLKFVIPANMVGGSISDLWDRRATEICGNGEYKKTIYKAERALAYDGSNYVYVAGDYIYEGFLVCNPAPTKS